MNNRAASFGEFEDIYIDIGNKKIQDLGLREIAKYLLVANELDWMDNNVGDDKIFYTYNEDLLEDLTYKLEDSLFKLIHEDILYNNDLHTEPELEID